MPSQSFANHTRYVPGFHFITLGAIVVLLIGSIINLVHAQPSNLYSASLICLIAVILGLMSWYTRQFPIKAQDRAIRAEENLRHYVLTGKMLDPKLTMNQIIALRFAPDEEFVELTKRTVTENLSSNDIKKAVKNWRADHHRA